MSSTGPGKSAQFDPAAAVFENLTLSFDAFFGRGTDGAARLHGRWFLRCNLSGPSLVAVGAGNLFADCIFSACAFTAVSWGSVVPGAIHLEDCRFEDCVVTRWAVYLTPDAATAVAQDMPGVALFGLPAGLF